MARPSARGFNDSHLHLLAYGFEMDHIDLGRADSIEEIIRISKKYIKKRNKNPGDWIFGAGWGQKHEADTNCMTKEDLDRISTEHPIYFLRICNHTAVVNSLALKMVGAGKGLSIKGGSFEKDVNGELNGVIRENALDWFEKMMPQPGKAEIKAAAENAIRDALKYGLTSLQSSDLHHFGSF